MILILVYNLNAINTIISEFYGSFYLSIFILCQFNVYLNKIVDIF